MWRVPVRALKPHESSWTEKPVTTEHNHAQLQQAHVYMNAYTQTVRTRTTASCPSAIFFSFLFFNFNTLLGVKNVQLNIFSWFTWWVNVINELQDHLANTTPLPINVMGGEC